MWALPFQEHLKSWWFLRHSEDIQYLLPTQSRLPHGVLDDTPSSEGKKFQNVGLAAKRSEVIGYYFKSVKSVLRLQQFSLNSHKDVTREQVISILNELVIFILYQFCCEVTISIACLLR